MPRHPNGSISISTIADMIDEGYAISIHCNGTDCHHSATIDLEALAGKIGRDHRALAKDLLPYFRCGRCGSKDMAFNLHPPAPREGVVTPSPTPGPPVPREGVSYRAQKRRRKPVKKK